MFCHLFSILRLRGGGGGSTSTTAQGLPMSKSGPACCKLIVQTCYQKSSGYMAQNSVKIIVLNSVNNLQTQLRSQALSGTLLNIVELIPRNAHAGTFGPRCELGRLDTRDLSYATV